MIEVFLKKVFCLKLFSFLLLFSYTLNGQNTISLADAVKISLTQNNTLKRFKEKIKEKEAENEAAFGNYLPKVTLIGSYTYMGDNIKINTAHVKKSLDEIIARYGVEIGNNILPVPLPPDDFYNAIFSDLQQLPAYNLEIDKRHYPSANLAIIQPLFTGGKITAGKTFAESEYREAKIEAQKVRNETIKQIIDLYLGVLLLEQVVETRKEVADGIAKHKATAEKLVLEGVIEKYQLLRAKVALANAETELENDINKLQLAKLALYSAMGLKQDTTLTLSDKLKFTQAEINLYEAIDSAYSNQPVIKLLEEKKVMVKQKENAEKANFWPTIFAFGEAGFFRYDMPGVIQPPWLVGVGMKYELFSGFKDYYKVQSAQRLGSQLEFASKEARSKIRLWVNKAYNEIINARTKYKKLAVNIELASETKRMAVRRFEEGYGTSLEVVDATLQLQGEKIKRAAALYEYYKAISEYYLALGNIDKAVEIFEKAQVK